MASRLIILCGLALLASNAAVLFSSVKGEAAGAQAELQEYLNEELHSLDRLLAEYAITGDLASIQQVLDARIKRASISVLEWRDGRGKPLRAADVPVAKHYPVWFGAWIAFHDTQGKRDVVVGAEKYGEVEVILTAVPATNRIWSRFQLQLLILFGGMLLFVVITAIVVRSGLEPLRDLARSATALESGDYSSRIALAGTPEMQVAARAFNAMADRIEALLVSLHDREVRLNETLAEQRGMLDNSVIGISFLKERRFVWVNRKHEEMFGYTKEELAGQTTELLFESPDAYRQFGEHAYPSMVRGDDFSGECHMKRKDGVLIWCNLSGRLVDPSESERGSIWIVEDITQSKFAKDALRESEARLREITSTLGEGVYVVDSHGVVTYANPEAHRLLGLGEGEMQGRNAHALFHYQRRDGTPYPIEECILHGELGSDLCLFNGQEDWFWRKDGSSLPVAATSSSILRDGKPAGAVVAFHDITEQLANRERLEQTLSEQQAILDNAMVGIAFVRNHRIVWANNRMETLLDYSREEIIGQMIEIFSATTEDSDEFGKEAYALLTEGRDFVRERQLKRKDGSLFWCHVAGKLVDVAAPAKGSIWIFGDITERKDAEEKLKLLNQTLADQVQNEVGKNREKDHLLIQQSRLAAMGEMIGNIAHQWRQPLNTLGLLLANIKDAYDFGEMNSQFIDESAQTGYTLIQKMSSTIDDFRNFFRPNREKTRFCVNKAVRESMSMVDASFSHNHIRVTLEESGEVYVLGFPGEYSQVVLNLLSNARDAILSKQVPNGEVRIEVSCEDGDARVFIRDNGGGIPDGIVERIFDPYFTTREKGTGIGLYMSKMIIENNMSGSIEVLNIENGAEFIVVTPLSPETAA